MDMNRRIQPILFVISGTFNVLLIKWIFNSQGIGQDGILRNFWHPTVLTFLMFLGQFISFIVYQVIYLLLVRRDDGTENDNMITRGGREFSPLSMLLPAFLDTIATLLSFIGLYLTYVSSYQMIRSAAIIFIGIFSSITFNQRLISRHWTAIFTISCGIIVVLSIDVQRVEYDTAVIPSTNSNSILTGELLILISQIFRSLKCVYLEKHLKTSDLPPMQVSGWIGIFGSSITFILAICTNFLPTQIPFNDNTRGVLDDLGDVFSQLQSNSLISILLISFIISSMIYNYAAFSIIKFSSATNKILCDGLSTILVWWFALLCNWENLNLISIMAFLILEMGAIIYRNAIFLEWYRSMVLLARNHYSNLHNDRIADAEQQAQSRPADVI